MKILVLGIVLLILLGIGGVFLKQVQPASPTAFNTPAQTNLVQYAGAADISFVYPKRYTLTERKDSFEGSPIVVITLIDANTSVPDMSDGPPAISIIEVPNPSDLSLSEWVKQKSISNFNLSPDQKLSSTTVGGEPAVSYVHSGLYESQALAAEHNKNIFLLSVGSVDASDAIYGDFHRILQTVQFK